MATNDFPREALLPSVGSRDYERRLNVRLTELYRKVALALSSIPAAPPTTNTNVIAAKGLSSIATGNYVVQIPHGLDYVPSIENVTLQVYGTVGGFNPDALVLSVSNVDSTSIYVGRVNSANAVNFTWSVLND